MTDINKLEELAKAATPGPWTMNAGFLDSRGLFPMFQLFGECECGAPLGPVTGTDKQAEADATYIATANPVAILSLISKYRRMEEALKGADSWLERWATHVGACRGGGLCECGLTAIQYETRGALQALQDEDQ